MFMADVSIIVRRMRVQSDRAMSDLGVGFPEQSVLMILRAYGAANQDAIASRLGIDKGSVAKTIAKLEEKDLVKRAVNPKNKREKIVETTPQTEQIMKTMEETLKDMEAMFFNGFSDEEIKTATSLLARIAQNAQLGGKNE